MHSKVEHAERTFHGNVPCRKIDGDALRLVVVDKMPFDAPSPISAAQDTQARVYARDTLGLTGSKLERYPFDALAELTAPVIAIDGPSASGKGTVAARVAAALGWHYLDSGALYRLTAVAARRAGVAWDDEAGVAAIAAGLDVVFGENSVFLAGEDVGDAIRQEDISVGASKVAALPAVRAALLFRQRLFRQAPGLVADGRDMASVVFPDAQTKVFLTASVEIRAERRYKQLIEKGIAASIQPLLLDLRERDARDSQRSVAPLKQNEDAELLDTTNLTIEQAVAQVLSWRSK